MTITVTAQAIGSERNFMADGACLGINPGLFYPEELTGVNDAKRICQTCTVRRDCLEHALSNGEKFGVWGGTSERERARIARIRRTRSA